ncbi:hypothetical protein [Aliiglaciecola litoralis]|uniref:Uncharacterized protein n=1 Tax=Aliiglaciecola litoralis TaxID=582857 RepID=A0ABP3X1E4_9ALTE
MIYVFHASEILLKQLYAVENERELVTLVMLNLANYQLAGRVKNDELDIAFAATGGPSTWLNTDNLSIDVTPEPERDSRFGDILVEVFSGYVNLSTPAGFIPLVDAVEQNGELSRKQLN